MRRLVVAACVAVSSSGTCRAFDHRHEGHYHRGFGSGWGQGFGIPGAYSYGFSSIGFGGGGFNYYHGPVGGLGIYSVGGYYGPVAWPGWGYPVAAPWWGYTAPVAPVTFWGPPLWPGLDPANNPAIQEWMPQQQQPQAAQPEPPLAGDEVRLFVKPSTAEARRKSIRYQAIGDEYFSKDNYLQALSRYKQSSGAAADRPEPRYRAALALAALGYFGQAADEFKKVVRLDADWPMHGERLDDVFGADHHLAKNAMLSRAADWVKEDVRDPERLYVMGVLLHFNEEADKARTCFEAASLLAGAPRYVQAFLTRPRPAAAGAAPRNRDAPAADQPEPPEEPTPRPLSTAPSPAAPRRSGPRLPPPPPPVTRVADDR